VRDKIVTQSEVLLAAAPLKPTNTFSCRDIVSTTHSSLMSLPVVINPDMSTTDVLFVARSQPTAPNQRSSCGKPLPRYVKCMSWLLELRAGPHSSVGWARNSSCTCQQTGPTACSSSAQRTWFRNAQQEILNCLPQAEEWRISNSTTSRQAAATC
jgi:hypothetical protein